MGEPAGIGGDVTLKVWHLHRENLSPFYVLDSPKRLSELARGLSLDVPIEEIAEPAEAIGVFPDRLPVLPINLPAAAVPGKLDPTNASAVRQSIEIAVEHVMDGRASAVVTNPIHKLALYKDGFEYPGHTEFLAALADVQSEPVMMLAGETLRVVPITRHVSLHDALDLLTADLIAETTEITVAALKRDFGIAAPRVALAGLNPHAGEGGAMGHEELDVIGPITDELRAKGIDIRGPLPPDTMFYPAMRQSYDVAICMYHDQALIPIKTIEFDSAVNVTLGLPFIRTSPDHGTALDLAGTGKANETSLLAAIRMASLMARHRFSGRSVPASANDRK